MQRNFEPMRNQVEAWQRSELTDVTPGVVIYKAFVEGKLEAPKHLARTVHDLYFEPKDDEFRSRTIGSLSNAFTSVFKQMDPIPQFKTRNWGSFWKPGSRSCSSLERYRPGGRFDYCRLLSPWNVIYLGRFCASISPNRHFTS